MNNVPTVLATTVAPSTESIEITTTLARVDNDDHLVRLWLHGLTPSTRRAYAADTAAFRAHIGGALPSVTLGVVHDFTDSLAALAPATQARRLSAVKSLLSFGHRVGYLRINVGAALRLPKVKNTLPERILDVDGVLHMLALERHPRNKALLRLLYLSGLRISEACGLRQRDLQPNGDAGQVTVFGKGGKTRVVLLKVSIWAELDRLQTPDPDMAMFRSRQGGGARWPVGSGLGALAAPRPCQPRARPRRTCSRRAGDCGTRQPCHHQPLRPCATDR